MLIVILLCVALALGSVGNDIKPQRGVQVSGCGSVLIGVLTLFVLCVTVWALHDMWIAGSVWGTMGVIK